MKTATATLITMLATSKEFVMVETYVFTLSDGTTLTYTSADVSVWKSTAEPQAPVLT